MKKLIVFIVQCGLLLNYASAAQVNIGINGFTYTPSTINASLGDTVTISASSFHPLVQVSETTWNMNGSTVLAGGWGTKTSDYTFVISTTDVIYFVCANHVSSSGMKGKITVTTTGIDPFVSAKNITLYPNPSTTSELTIRRGNTLPANISLKLYDLSGKLIQTHNISGLQQTINIDLPEGIYFYRFDNTGRSTRVNRLIIAN